MVGSSAGIQQVHEEIRRVAKTDITVLVLGETGTGKELCAEAIHAESTRKDGPFVVVDLGAIVPNLIESHLFGHEKGAFTGAYTQNAGAFELANGGTIFLDEIGELPLYLQPKLLRAIERRQFRRVGGADMMRSDIRIIAATNRDLAAEAKAGRFRSDLYHRLHVAELRLPPLRDRLEDLPELVAHFLAGLGAEATRLDEHVMNRLLAHDWPGNVRELRHVVERTWVLGEPPSFGPRIKPVGEGPSPDAIWVPIDVSIPYRHAKEQLLAEFERRYTARLLALHGGNVSRAARAAGLDRMWLSRILVRRGVRPPPTSARDA